MDVLKGCRVLILEEQRQIALVLAKMVEDLGCKVIGPANNVPDALRFIDENTVDAAILDVNIGGNDTLAIADELIERSIPFAFTSGNKTPASIERLSLIHI